MQRTLKLSELMIDPALTALRPVNPVFVSRYRQAYRAGADLGQIIVNADDNTVVSGNHRVTAMLAEFGPDHKIAVEARKFKIRRDVLETFARENVAHGNALSGFSKRSITLALLAEGEDAKDIATLFGVSVRRVEQWGEMVVTTRGSSKPRPLKRGLEHIAGSQVTKAQYAAHRDHDRGIPARSMAEQLTRWLEAGWIDEADEGTMAALGELAEALDAAMSVAGGA